MMATMSTTSAFTMMINYPIKSIQTNEHIRCCRSSSSSKIYMSTWDDFKYDDDDELIDSGIDSEFVAADENDDAAVKAAAGLALEAPEVDWDGDIIDVPQGM